MILIKKEQPKSLFSFCLLLLSTIALIVSLPFYAQAQPLHKGQNGTKTLIVYFSLTGHTKHAAQYIQSQTGADMIRLRPRRPYKNNADASHRGLREQRENIHPALSTKIPHFSRYHTVLIGYPTWSSKPPMVIHTLFDDYNFRSKTVVPFTTSASTPIGPSQRVIRRLANHAHARFKNGIRYDHNNGQVKNWLQSLELERH